MRPTGDYATFDGVEYQVVARGPDRHGWDYVGLLLDHPAQEVRFEQVIDWLHGRRMAKVSRDQLQRFERVTTTGTVDGASVTLLGVDDPVPCEFAGDPAWAAAHGFTGSQHDGWSGTLARRDIIDVHETVIDLLRVAEAGGGR